MIAAAVETAPPLVDGFGRVHSYLRIAVTDRCNLRCMYCMPAEGITPMPGGALLTAEEIIRITRVLAAHGVTRVRLTGGEPLARRDLPAIVAGIRNIEGITSVALTTNGTLLARNVEALRQAGLDRINISLDSLREERFARITLRERYGAVREGIERALEAGFARVKLNVVVMRGVNDDELCDFVEFVRTRDMTVRFIEYMPFVANGWHRADCLPWRDMLARIAGRYCLVPVDAATDTGVAKEYHVEGLLGRIGFITSMTDHFCDSCNRLRLTADGALKTCLFHPADGDLRTPLREGADDAALAAHIAGALARKPRAHAAVDDLAACNDRTMILIGG